MRQVFLHTSFFFLYLGNFNMRTSTDDDPRSTLYHTNAGIARHHLSTINRHLSARTQRGDSTALGAEWGTPYPLGATFLYMQTYGVPQTVFI